MKIEKVTVLSRLVEVRDVWNTLLEGSSQNCVFLTNEWFTAWFESFGESSLLSVFLFWENSGRLLGAAPFMKTGEGLKFIASSEVTDYCDFIVLEGQEERFFRNFIDVWQKELQTDTGLRLINIRENSPTLSVLPLMAYEHQLDCSVFQTEVAPSLNLPQSYEDYLTSLPRKNRHELRRKKRRLEAQKGLLCKHINNPDDVRHYVELFIELHKGSRVSKREFWEKKGMERFFRDLTAVFSKKGWVEFNALFLDRILVAILMNFKYGEKNYFYNIAFNPNYAEFSPGIYLFDVSIQKAIEEKRRQVDFLRGREKYKFFFGAKECKIMDFILSKKS